MLKEDKMNIPENSIISIPYYREDQYDLLSNISIDKENFRYTYEESLEITKIRHHEMEQKGFKVIRMDVDVYELIKWCDFHKLNVTPKSRTQFALELLKDIYYEKE